MLYIGWLLKQYVVMSIDTLTTMANIGYYARASEFIITVSEQ